MKLSNLEEILRVLAAVAEADHTDMVWWRTDEEYTPVTFLVNCNDCFYWATADCEEITSENLPLFEQTLKDAREAEKTFGSIYAGELFAARVRKMRPQYASYAEYPPEMWPLFDACGPERQTDNGAFGNPGSRAKAEEKSKQKWDKLRSKPAIASS